MPVLGIFQGLATILIAAAGAFIAWQQKRLADVRLQNDLFDRRFRIFEAARKLIRNALHRLPIPFEDMQAFALETADAAFFFEKPILDYLDDLQRRVGRLNGLVLIIDGQGGGEDINAAISEKKDTLIWLSQEIQGIVQRFKPSMALSTRSGWV